LVALVVITEDRQDSAGGQVGPSMSEVRRP